MILDDYRLTACINVLKWIQERSQDQQSTADTEGSSEEEQSDGITKLFSYFHTFLIIVDAQK